VSSHVSVSGLGEDDLDVDRPPVDFNRGSGGEPMIPNEDGKVERFARCSSLGAVLDEKSGLNNWLTSKALEGAARDQSILARALASSPYEDHKSDWTRIREDAIQAGRGAYRADLGTAVHAMADRFEQDETYDPGGVYTPALEAYTKALADVGLKSQLFEAKLVNDERKVAGSADRIVETTLPLVAPDGVVIPPGELLIGDMKTGKSLEFSIPGYAVQMAAYAGAVLYDVVENVRLPTPPIRQDWGVIFHLDVEEVHCEMLWVDLAVGRFGADLAEAVREWRRSWRRKNDYKASVVPVLVADSSVGVASDVAASQPEKRSGAPDPGDLSSWQAFHRERLTAIRANDSAKEWMLLRWPKGLPSPKNLTALEEAAELDDFIGRVEAEFGLPFVAGRPAERKQKESGS
jgi:hypothetical protein